ncbi:MAG: outer membrane lipoprotein carrier protein LolA [Elusimicrobiota bacterium]|jgi:outer membrane lipoprotein-sorting protein|nr:outer membrane lipoprotein carrier protein LolA [Elusimicrobiota bacterium]
MKHFLLFFILIFTCAAVRAAEQTVDTAAYAKFAVVQTISSDFTIEKRLSIAQKPLISAGHFYFERPGFLRWEYNKPFAHGIILDGGKALSWRGGAKAGSKKEIKDISAEPWAKAVARQVYMFVAMDVKEISARYNIAPFENGLTLQPKDNSALQAVEKINLYFNAEGDAVKKVEMLDKSGDSTIIIFSATKLNEPIPQSAREP